MSNSKDKKNSLKDVNLSGYIPFIYLQWVTSDN